MPESDQRGLTVTDILILIAGLAFGMGLMRGYFAAFARPNSWYLLEGPFGLYQVRDRSLFEKAVDWPYGVLLLCSPFVMGATVVVPLLQWRRARHSGRRALGRPGSVACVASAFVLLLNLLNLIVWYQRAKLTQGIDNRILPIVYSFFLNTFHKSFWSQPGPAVAGAWLALWLSGRCRCRTGWTDRAGYLVGLYWILLWILSGPMLYR